MRFRWVWIFTAIIVLIADSSHADDFYKGKTIRVIVGGSAGGGFDIYTRAMTMISGLKPSRAKKPSLAPRCIGQAAKPGEDGAMRTRS